MKKFELINHCLAQQKKRDPELITSYLEIGVDNPNNTFNHVKADIKVGVDPYNDGTGCHIWNDKNKSFLMHGIQGGHFFKKTSDQYFADMFSREIPFRTAEIVFIDGMHEEEFVMRDFNNSARILSKDGVILIDDVMPTNPVHIKMPPDPGQEWMGTVFRAFWRIRQIPGWVTGVIAETGMGFAFRGENHPTNGILSNISNKTDMEVFLSLMKNDYRQFNKMSFHDNF